MSIINWVFNFTRRLLSEKILFILRIKEIKENLSIISFEQNQMSMVNEWRKMGISFINSHHKII